MRISGLARGLVVGMFCGMAGSAAWANPPQDIASLLEKWDKAQKTGTTEQVMDAPKAMNYDKFPLGSLLESELKRGQQRNPGEAEQISFNAFTSDGRKQLLHALFPTKMKELTFCSGFVQKPFVPRPADSATPEKLAEAKLKHIYTDCKRTTEGLLGGILHDNATVYLYRAAFGGDKPAEEVVAYIKSKTDATSYLRYRFQVK